MITLWEINLYCYYYVQTVGDCSTVQSAVSSDDDSRGKLYVLDAGFNICEPKVIVYDLRTNKKVRKTHFMCIHYRKIVLIFNASHQNTAESTFY